MATVNAVTDGAGHRPIAGFDAQHLRPLNVYGERLDPWDLIKEAKNRRPYRFRQFFREDKKGNLSYPALGVHNLLARHIQRELGLGESDPAVHVSTAKGAKMIEIDGGESFLIHAGKIYRKEQYSVVRCGLMTVLKS